MKILDGLNDGQVHAVTTPRGPLCILAGAGSGKTTTITRRIAFQVTTDEFLPHQILALTFTDKAAKEMGSRLSALGVGDVRCKTFHAEALWQYHQLSDDGANLIPSKFALLKTLVGSLPPPHKFKPVRDIATEIEWAKNRRVPPDRYLSELGDHRPPLPAEIMASVYAGYEKRKQRTGTIDFEDLLELTIRLYAEKPDDAWRISRRYHAFTVDEYQDVNLLQQTLLDLWLDGRDELCVVGDDYQSIYGFTGATPNYLLGFSDRYPSATSVTLTDNYRSTPQVLEIANKLVPRLGGTKKELKAVATGGPAPSITAYPIGDDEIASIVHKVKELNALGIPLEEMAVLYRINARSEEFEEAFAAAAIPFHVQDSAFLQRPAARALLAELKRSSSQDVKETVAKTARALGYREDDESDGQEATRQADLARLIRLGAEYPGTDGIPGFLVDLVSRFTNDKDARGVQLLTYHRAKGKEYEAVFLPRVEDSELPFGSADDNVIEERRLFYVGITRSKKHLFISWAKERPDERKKKRYPSRFLAELRQSAPAQSARTTSTTPMPSRAPNVDSSARATFESLKRWARKATPPSSVPHEWVLAQIAERRPADFAALLDVPGLTPSQAALFGVDLLQMVEASSESTGKKAEHPNAYERWTKQDEERLVRAFKDGKKTIELAMILGRQPGGIKSRLRKLGLIE